MLKAWLCSIAYCLKITFGESSWEKKNVLFFDDDEEGGGWLVCYALKYKDKSNVNRYCGAWSDLLCGVGTPLWLIANHNCHVLRGLPLRLWEFPCLEMPGRFCTTSEAIGWLFCSYKSPVSLTVGGASFGWPFMIENSLQSPGGFQLEMHPAFFLCPILFLSLPTDFSWEPSLSKSCAHTTPPQVLLVRNLT